MSDANPRNTMSGERLIRALIRGGVFVRPPATARSVDRRCRYCSGAIQPGEVYMRTPSDTIYSCLPCFSAALSASLKARGA